MKNMWRYLFFRYLKPGWNWFLKNWFLFVLFFIFLIFVWLLLFLIKNHFVIDNFVCDTSDYLKELGITFFAVFSAFSLDSFLKKEANRKMLIAIFVVSLVFSCNLYIGSEYFTNLLSEQIAKWNKVADQIKPSLPEPEPATSSEKSLNDPNANIVIPKGAKK